MAIVASYDWESDTYSRQAPAQAEAAGTLAFDTAAWTQAVQAEATSMKTHAGADLHTRIDAATALVLENQVELGLAGHASVASRSTAGRRYTVNGSCGCQDAQYNGPYCAHRIAVALLSRATKSLAAPVRVPDPSPHSEHCPSCFVAFDAEEIAQEGDICAVCALMQATPPPVSQAPAPAACPEAAFSITLKGTMDGMDALLTARGATWQEFTANVHRLKGLLDAPVARTAAPSADLCPIHEVVMTRQTNDRGSWLSHRTDGGGWCKGTPPGTRR